MDPACITKMISRESLKPHNSLKGDEMINTLRFLIPNLTRRPDRWKYCHESLLRRGVPAENIERFPALDGLEYLDKKQDHTNLKLIRDYVSQLFDDNLPPFLQHNAPLTFYAWNCTWYLGLLKIARQDNLVCWMIDDVSIDINYKELLHHVEILSRVSHERCNPLLAIQLARIPRRKNIDGEPVPECPVFQFGYAAQDDDAFVYSPQGAAKTLEFANQHIKIGVWNPCLLTSKLTRVNLDHFGFFGVSPNVKPTPRSKGLISTCEKIELRFSSLEQYGCTDRHISQSEIDKSL